MERFGEQKIIRVTPGSIRKNIESRRSSGTSFQGMTRNSGNDNDEQIGLDLYVQGFKLSNSCLHFIRKNLRHEINITLRWTVLDNEDSVVSPPLDSNRGKFDYTAHYDFILDDEFFHNFRDSPIIFRLYACTVKDELFLSETQLVIPNVAQVVNVKQESRIIFTSDLIDAHDEIANVNLWFKFTCNQLMVKAFSQKSRYEKKKSLVSNPVTSRYIGMNFSGESHNFNNVVVTDSELDHFADSVWLVLNRNKVLKTTQSDMNNELQQRVRWLQFEANWKQTLQENAILHGNNPKAVIWRQWREENTVNVKLRTYNKSRSKKYASKLTITVVDLSFLDDSSVMRNEDMRQFYIEYSFLGYEGPKMEAPFSKPKKKPDEKIVFNFKKTFPIHLRKNKDNCVQLTKLIMNDGSIKFIVISEPMENPERPIQTCQEVGYAEVPISEIIQLEKNVITYEFEVIDSHNQSVVLGYLTITIEGILAMRSMALKKMAPRGYRLFL